MSCDEAKVKVPSAPAQAGESSSPSQGGYPGNGGPASAGGGAKQNSVAVYDPLPPCTGEYDRSLRLYSSTQPQLQARFGPPARKEAYRVVERQGEFYGLVEEIYPMTDPKNLDVPIEEWTWEKGDCRLTVWFHRPDGTWRALGDVLYHYADEF